MLNDQKLGNYLEVSNRTNQFQIQVVRERRDPLLGMTREPYKMEETSRSQEIDVNSFHEDTVSLERTCGEGEVVVGVHTLVWRSVQVYHELQELGRGVCAQNGYREKWWWIDTAW